MMVLACDPGLETTGLAMLAGPAPSLGTPLNVLSNRLVFCASLRSEKGTDEERFAALAEQLVEHLKLLRVGSVFVLEAPARANTYRRTANRQREAGTQMNMADVLRNVRLGGYLGGFSQAIGCGVHRVQYVKADEMPKKGRDGWIKTMTFNPGVRGPANEHERDALWLGLRAFNGAVERNDA